MKKAVLFLGLMFFLGTAKAQDTIPFLDPCFGYQRIFDAAAWQMGDSIELPLDSLNSMSINQPSTFNGYSLYTRFDFPGGARVLGIATTPYAIYPNEVPPVHLFSYDGTLQIIDSQKNDSARFYKQTYYTYNNPKRVVPCNIYLYQNPIQTPDFFYIGYHPMSFRNNTLSDPGCIYCIYNCSINITCNELLILSNGEITTYNAFYDCLNGYWGGFFPILELPCPKPAKPHVGPNYAGDVTLRWAPGDTSLYQLAFHTYQDDTPVYTTDTLTDTLFHLVDSLAPAAMADGRYTVRIRKACNYMDSPYHTIVWSDWSEPMQFLYMHRREGLVGPGTEILPFSLTPNPTAGDATLTFDTPLPADATLEVYGPDGRLLDSFTLPAGTAFHRLATASYSSGLYLLHLVTPSAAGTQKLSIQH